MKLLPLYFLIATFAVACTNPDQSESGIAEDPVILVTGATGTQGGAVARELLNRGYAVRGLTRNPDSDRAKAVSQLGAEMVKGDFDDAMSLAAAMDGVHGVFAMTDFWEHGFEKEVAHGKQLIDAARKAGVQYFVYTSVAGADGNSGIPHFESKHEVEILLRESGIDFSIVRPVEFMDNIRYIRDEILSGAYVDPRDSDSSHQWIAASDIGFFVAEAFDKPDDWRGQTVEIAGDELTIAEFVDVLSRSTTVDVHHQQPEWSDYEGEAGEEMTLMMRWFENSGYLVDVAALRKRYPSLLTYEQFLQQVDWN